MRFLLLLVIGLPGLAQDTTAAIQNYLQNQRQQGFMGSILVAQGGRVLLQWGMGNQNLELQSANNPATKFRIASITKQFTASAIMQLQEAGKLQIGDLACRYVDGCPDQWKSITIYELLTHTAGVYDPWWMLEFYTPSIERVPLLPVDLLMVTRDIPVSFPPGTGWAYSNANFFFLGVIIEKVSGEKYADYLQKHFFTPLGMSETGFDEPAVLLSNRASGYSFGPDGLYNTTYIDTSLEYSAFGLYSTTGDLYRWDRALYTDAVLTKASRDAMFTGSIITPNYGFGLDLSPWFGHKQMGHVGWTNGFVTCFARFPDDDAAIIVLSNVEDLNSTTNAFGVAQGISQILLPPPASSSVQSSAAHRTRVANVAAAFPEYEKPLDFSIQQPRFTTPSAKRK